MCLAQGKAGVPRTGEGWHLVQASQCIGTWIQAVLALRSGRQHRVLGASMRLPPSAVASATS